MAGNRDIIVVGASAGGVEALSELVGGLPADLPAAVFVVLHLPRTGLSVLPSILSRRGPLPARVPEDGEPVRRGTIYVAPPDRHLLLHDGRVRLTRGPSENGHRPAVDPLFRSAARAANRRVIGVVLSGMLDDGTAGLLTIRRCGGVAVVQDPTDALFDSMPTSALEQAGADHVVPVNGIGALLARLASEPLPAQEGEGAAMASCTEGEAGKELEQSVDAALLDPASLDSEDRPGAPSVYSCPGCGGVLWEVDEEDMMRFRCRTGHAYSATSLLAEQAESLDEALWAALRALEESASLARRLHERSVERGHRMAAERFEEQMRDASTRAAVIRRALRGEGRNGAEGGGMAAHGEYTGIQ